MLKMIPVDIISINACAIHRRQNKKWSATKEENTGLYSIAIAVNQQLSWHLKQMTRGKRAEWHTRTLSPSALSQEGMTLRHIMTRGKPRYRLPHNLRYLLPPHHLQATQKRLGSSGAPRQTLAHCDSLFLRFPLSKRLQAQSFVRGGL